ILVDRHTILKNYYISTYQFNRCLEYSDENSKGFLLILDNQNLIDQAASQLKTYSEVLAKRMKIELPDLTDHISQNKYFEKYWRIKSDQINRYLSPLSLQHELPRVSAQARILYKAQQCIWENLLQEYTEHRTILDIGCGPGIY